MNCLSIKNIPERLFIKLKEMADKNGVTIEAQLISILDFFLFSKKDCKKRRKNILKSIKKNAFIDTQDNYPTPEALIREDRER